MRGKLSMSYKWSRQTWRLQQGQGSFYNIFALLKIFVIVALLSSSLASAQEKKLPTGFLDFNFYPYTEEKADTAFTINVGADLESGFQYASLTNFNRDPESAALTEFDTFYTEQDLRWSPFTESPYNIFQLSFQAVLRTGVDNDAFRLGLRWKTSETPGIRDIFEALNGTYSIVFHGAQFDKMDGYQWQIEHRFRFNILPEAFDNRVYLAGFADHNFNHEGGLDTTWVEEAQLGVRLVDNWYAIAEQRYNGFRKGDESSLGLGVEYLIRFGS